MEIVKAGKVSLDTGRIAMKLFEQRMQGDYDLYVVFSGEQASEIKQNAADFVKTIRTALL